MINISKLKGKIVEKNLTQEGIADSIGINRTTFYRKMRNGAASFSVEEVVGIAKELQLEPAEVMDIFFPELVAEMQPLS